MNKILWQLCKDNVANFAATRENFVSNAAGQTLYIRGVIAEGFEANAADVIANLAKANPNEVLNIRFNTPGGDVFVGKEIAAAIRNYGGRTIGHVDSLCASAGTSIAIACSEIEMSKGAFFMIHPAQTVVGGDKKALRDRADLMEKIELSIVDDYTGKTGKTAEEVIALMDAVTWMNADEALAHGFIDRIAGEPAKVGNSWNLSAYANVPQALTAPPAADPEPAPPPQPEPAPEVIPPPESEPVAPLANCMAQANRNRLTLITAL